MVAASNTPTRKVIRRKKTADTGPDVEEMQSESASLANLQAYVPSPDISTKYVGRQINGVWDMTIADEAAKAGENILLMGDTGSGKTLFGEAYASFRKKIYYSVPCDVSIDPSALFGKMVPDEDGGIRWQDGPVTQVARGECGLGANCKDSDCDGGVLNISEVNFMTPKIAASTFPMLDHRRYIPLLAHRGEIVGLHPRTIIICDLNPQYRGTMELNAAFLNRFPHKIKWGYNEAVEAKLIKSASIRDIAKKLRALAGTEVMTPVSTNMLMEMESFAIRDAFGIEYAIANFVSAFGKTEQKAVGDVFELAVRQRLTNDIDWIKKKKVLAVVGEDESSDDELEEVEFDFEEE